MNRWIPVISILFFAAATAENADIHKLAWLGGCWKTETAEASSEEHWLPLAGGTLLGVSRTVKQGKTVAHEFMQIREGSEGKLVFIAQPSGQQLAEFPLISIDETEAVFENPEHDFPQRIIYARKDSLLDARIEGKVKGHHRVVRFPMQRVNCDSLLAQR